MLGLGLSLTSPLRILTADSGGGGPQPGAAFIPYFIGNPGPSTNSTILTETFYTQTVDLGGGVYKIHTYEFFIPNLPPTGGNLDPTQRFGLFFWGQYLTTAITVNELAGIDTDMETVSDFSLALDNDAILDGDEGQTVFKEFVKYLYETQQSPNGSDYLGRDYLFSQTEGIQNQETFRKHNETGGEANTVEAHSFVFNESALNSVTEAFYPEFNSYLEFLDSDEYPGTGIFNNEYSQDLRQCYGILYRVNTITVTENVDQPALIQLPSFGVAPTASSLIMGYPTLVAGAFGFTSSENELILGGPPSNVGGVYTVPFTIMESYIEQNGIPILGTDLYPLGMHDNGTTPISTFHTNFSIGFAGTQGFMETFPTKIVYTDAGSFTTSIGGTKIKNFVYTGTLQIEEEDFPGLYASAENNTIAIPTIMFNVYNTVPGSNVYTVSDTVALPYGTPTYLPILGVGTEELLEWLTTYEPDVPGTSLSVIPATNNTYNATPPGTNPTITQYSTALPLKGVHVSFDGAVADLSTAYATSGTDFTFIAIGINKNVTSATEQLIVNRKTTTEGVGIKSDSTYIKLKNAAIPTDTTPAGTPTQDYQNYVPFFIYLEKTSTIASEYNEFNEEVKRYAVGANDILELDRITNNFAGSLSYIAIKDNVLTNTQRARLIENLRMRYLDINVINRYE